MFQCLFDAYILITRWHGGDVLSFMHLNKVAGKKGRESVQTALPLSQLSVPAFAVGPQGACRASSAENRETTRSALC
jgi:hypothetical protein